MNEDTLIASKKKSLGEAVDSEEVFDLEHILASLPIKSQDVDHVKRCKDLFNHFDDDHKGYLTLHDFDRGIISVLHLDAVHECTPVVNNAFDAAIAVRVGKHYEVIIFGDTITIQ